MSAFFFWSYCVSQMEVEVNVAPGLSVSPTASPNICVRAGCTNPAVESKDWDKEYCSNECVATHCRCVFVLMIVWFKLIFSKAAQTIIVAARLVCLLH